MKELFAAFPVAEPFTMFSIYFSFRKVMQGLFSILETELQSYIHFADRLDNLYVYWYLAGEGNVKSVHETFNELCHIIDTR